MRIYLAIFAILCLLFPTYTFAQDAKPEIDSLYTLLKNTASDTAKHRLYSELITKSVKVEAVTLESLGQKATANAKRIVMQIPDAVCGIYVLLGEVYLKRGELDKARALSRQILVADCYTAIPNWQGLAYTILALCNKQAGQLDSAVLDYERAIAVHEATGQVLYIGQNKGGLANIYRDKGEQEIALKLYQEGIELLQSKEDKVHIQHLYNGIGRLYRQTAKYDTARHYYEASLELMLEKKDQQGAAISYNNIGNIYQDKGDLDKALESYINSLNMKIAAGSSDQSVGIAYHNVGATRLDLGQYEKAREDIEKSMKLAENAKFKRLILYNHAKLGSIARELSEYDTALDAHQKALALSEEMGFQVGIAEGLVNIGRDHWLLQNFDTSIDYFQRALQLSEEIKQVKYINGALVGIAENYTSHAKIRLENPDFPPLKNRNINVEAYLNRAYDSSVEIGNQQNIDITLQALMNYHETNKNYRQAALYSRAYVQHKDSIYEAKVVDAIANWETKYETAEKEKEIALLEQRNKIATQESMLLKARNRSFIILAFGLLSLLLLGAYFFRQLRQSKREIEAKNTQLEALNATKDKFFGIIAHDIRSPITALDSVSEQMQYYLKKDDKAKLERLAGRIENTTSRLSSLLDNLLQWALLQTGMIPYQPTQMDVQKVAQENVELYQEVAALKNINLRNEVSSGTLAFADKRAVTTIIRNLVNNAIKFTPKGGEVSIGTKTKDDKIFISINDTGTGIAADKVAQLFSLQKKSKKGTAGEKGTGLGLMLCKDLVEMNRGTIRAISELEKGSSFIFSLPQAKNLISHI